jgi:hypothetical protein
VIAPISRWPVVDELFASSAVETNRPNLLLDLDTVLCEWRIEPESFALDVTSRAEDELVTEPTWTVWYCCI